MARSGDRVRARTANASTVEGVLVLRHVPTLDSVQVLVDGVQGDVVPVRADSVEVLTEQVRDPYEVVRDDPLREDPGWRPVHDLDEARRIGFDEPAREGTEEWWAALDRWMDRALQPLVAAGWQMTDRSRETSWEYGDSVACLLHRDGTAVSPELYDDHALALWDASDEGADGVSRDVEWVDADLPIQQLRRAYRRLGFLP